jgi:hypothetical protein
VVDRDPPQKGDVIVLSKETFFRSEKPSTLTLSKGELVGPEVLFPGTELEIIEVDHSIGFASYSWAKVSLLFEAK